MTPMEFCSVHGPALERDEARHNKMLGLFGAMVGDQALDVATWSLGEPGQCAIMAPGRPIQLGDLDADQCRALAEQTAPLHYPGVGGPEATPHWFAQRASELGARFLEPVPQRIHSLTEKPRYPAAPGHVRPTTTDDTELLADWIAEFRREATPHEGSPSRERLDSLARAGTFFWVVGDQPVSMAAILRRTRNGAAISVVYTPPQQRGKGYAGCVTAAVVEQVFAEGKTMACLYTDVRNPFSNRCYAKIGFKPVCDCAHIPRA
jgi:RimJ/RimL family protein N-acetyltransferase